MNPKIIVIGKAGQVGWELRRTLAPLGPVVAIDFPEIDLTKVDSIRNIILEQEPQIIVNAAAYTAVDKAEAEVGTANAINAVAPGILAGLAKDLGALLVHFSTDYVYDGQKGQPYLETDSPNPLSAYGRTKLAGDRAIQDSGCSHLIFRLCWVYGARGQNFMRTMLRLASEREQLRVVNDQYGCPTWSRMIAQVVALALQKGFATGSTRHEGVYHLAASGYTSWHGFAQKILDLSPADKKCSRIEPIVTSEYPTAARRPAYSVLNCDKLHKTFGLRLPDWEESLRQVLEV